MEFTHGAFELASKLDEPWRTHFPKSQEEARSFIPHYRLRGLSMCVLCVAKTRIECAWSAYVDAVPGIKHELEYTDVLHHGQKLTEEIARAVFPEFPKEIPYHF